MDEDLRESYRTLEKRLFHEGRFVTPSFIVANNMLPSFQDVGLEPFLTLNEPICPRFVVELYHGLKVKRDEEERPYIKFKLGQFTFNTKDRNEAKMVTRALMTVMLANKLQVDESSEMANELLRKIFYQVNHKFRGGLLGIKVFYKVYTASST
ncbi:hypothetical protein Tco_0103476 [Tanacetum coccineum]